MVLFFVNHPGYGNTLGLERGAFTCDGWQVKLCDPIWQVTPRSSEIFYAELYRAVILNPSVCRRLIKAVATSMHVAGH